MHDIFEDEKYLYIVMELLGGGEVRIVISMNILAF